MARPLMPRHSPAEEQTEEAVIEDEGVAEDAAVLVDVEPLAAAEASGEVEEDGIPRPTGEQTSSLMPNQCPLR